MFNAINLDKKTAFDLTQLFNQPPLAICDMLNIILFAILFAFVGTRNGRVLCKYKLDEPFKLDNVLTVAI